MLVGGTVALVLVAFLVPLLLVMRTISADDTVIDTAVVTQPLVVAVAGEEPAVVGSSVRDLNLRHVGDFSVRYSDGAVLGPYFARTPAVRLAERGQSLSTEVDGGREVLIAVVTREGGTAVIRAYLSQGRLYEGIWPALTALTLLGVLLLGLGVAVASVLATLLARPIREVADVSRRLASGDLSARARGGGAVELVDVAGALNFLARRIGALVTGERERIADLSHRLRTPLTALRLEADLLTDDGERARLNRAVDAVETTVTEAIAAVRAAGRERGTSDASAVVAERIEFWKPLTHAEDRPMTTRTAARPLPVAAPAAELRDVFDVLVSNVFRHTPPRTAFTVELVPRDGGGAVLTVDDEGPGLPDTRLIRRGRSGGGSSGLGLDIVRRLAENSGGALELGRSPAGGARIRIELGPPAEDR